jgi:uncharacterized protein YjbI with pentapeptide repeats
MAKRQRSGVLNRLAGKKLVFSGKFSYGVEDVLKAMAEAQQGTVCDDLTDKVDYLVLADLSAAKTIQKKAMTLNGKGATIQVIDADAFKNLAEPTDDEILALLRAGESETYGKIHRSSRYHSGTQTPKYTFHSEDLSTVTFKNAQLDEIHFEGCKFVGANFEQVTVPAATDCDFSKAVAVSSGFGDAPKCRFNKATLNGCHFAGDFSDADFTSAVLDATSFTDTTYYGYGHTKKTAPAGVRFTKARLTSAKFHELHLKSPDFSGADLTNAEFENCAIDAGTFCNATLREAVLVGCKLTGSDLSNADLTGANLAGADLTGATLAGANLKNANLRGTKLDRVDLSKVKNYDPDGATTGVVGPALTELDSVNAKAKRIQVKFHVRSAEGETGEQVGIDSSGLKWGWGLQIPQSIGSRRMFRSGGALAFSDAMLQLANVAGHLQVCFETLDVSSTKSPTGGKELRDLVMRGIAEAFAQEMPAEEELASATKKHRDAEREKGSAERERREQAKAEAVKQKEKAKKQIAKKVEKAVGKVSDVASFLKALEVRIEKPKIDKATKMLKASRFKLFNDVTDQYMSGVVKSQTDPDLVYACRVMHDGQYSCCTQNLNVCGGLRGSICKHLLVLIIGLVQAGELDPTTIDAWIAKTHSVKPELDKEIMGEIFIKYKGAEAGEVDWRPTETVPEDYYTL